MSVGVSIEQKVSLALLLPGSIMFFVTLAEPSWFSGSDLFRNGTSFRAGLWRFCEPRNQSSAGGSDADVCHSYNGSPEWITAPELLQCMTLSACLAATALSFRLIFRKTRVQHLMVIVLVALSGVLGIIGAVVFQKKIGDFQADWCFYVNITGDTLMLVAGLVLLFHFLRLNRQKHYQSVN